MQNISKKNILFILFISIFIMICSGIFFLNDFSDYDFLWHIKLGELFFKEKQISLYDSFSWVKDNSCNLYQFAHSWASEIIMYIIYTFSGCNLQIFGLLYCCLWSFIFYIIINKLFLNYHFLSTILYFLFAATLFSNPRPQLISNSLFVITLYILTNFLKGCHTKLVWLLPIISLLWANLHGGTVPILFALELFFIIISFIPSFELKNFSYNNNTIKNNRIKLILSTILSFFTGLLNPYNIRLYLYFFMDNNKITKQYVSEWQPITLLNPYTLFILGILLLPLFYKKYKYSLENWTIVFICLLLSGIHQRLINYSVLSIVLLLKDLQKQILQNYIHKDNTNIKWTPYKKREISLLIIFFVIIIVFFFPPKITNYRMSQEVVDFIKKEDYNQLYNSYNLGAQLIYEDIPVFIDSRADLYPDDIIIDSTLFLSLNYEYPGQVQDFLNKHNFDAILLETKDICPIEYLSLHKDWEIAFQNEEYYIFQKINY